jgi:exopolysaccharide production protein ExoZ
MDAGRDREYLGLQALRAIAALAVVAGHTGDYLMAQNGFVPPLLRWFHGPAGVDVFFVISGFVMTLSSGRLLKKEHPARIFLWRRILRIVPLYWLLTTVKIILLLVRPRLSAHPTPSVWNMVSSYLFIPSYGASGEIRPVIVVGWTLSFEMMFYVFFAIALARSRKRIGEIEQGWLLGFLVPSVGALGLLGFLRTKNWPDWTAFADPIVFEFLAGVGIAWLTLGGRLAGRKTSVALVLLGLAGLIFFVPGNALFATRSLAWGIPASVIVLGVVSLEPVIGKILPRWLLLLGNASYSIYLVQTFILPETQIILEKMRPEFAHTQPLWAGVVLTASGLLLTGAAGVACYLQLERRMVAFLKRSGKTELIAPVMR